jgi:thiamine-phosphate pyrophosphorylase
MMRLYVIAGRGVFGSDEEWLEALAAVAPAVAASDVARLQVRVKDVAPGGRLALIRRAHRVLGPHAAQAILNGNIAEALHYGFGGAHYPETSLPGVLPERPAGFLVGASVHSRAALDRAAAADVDFALFGPVFDAGSKPVAGVGLDALRELACASPAPVLAVGGITTGRVADCLAAGASGVAAITAIVRAPDPASRIHEFIEAFERVSPGAASHSDDDHFEPALRGGGRL